MNRSILRIVIPIVAAGLTSCVFLEKPLSDDETSKVDERLLGTWKPVAEQGEKGAPQPEKEERMAFRRKEGTKNTLECFDPSEKDQAKYIATYVRPGKPSLLTMAIPTPDGKSAYMPMKFEFAEDGSLKLTQLELNLFCEAVRKGELKGTAQDAPAPQPGGGEKKAAGEEKKEGSPVCIAVTVSSEPADVLRFIEKHGEKAFGPAVTYTKVAQ